MVELTTVIEDYQKKKKNLRWSGDSGPSDGWCLRWSW